MMNQLFFIEYSQIRPTKVNKCDNVTHRVKSAIAKQAGLVDISWDGFLKAVPVKGEWRLRAQRSFAKKLLPDVEEEKDKDI